MEFVPMLVLLAMVKSFVGLLKRVKAGDHRGALTQLLSYAVGVGVVLLFARTDFAAGLEFGGLVLSDSNVFTQVVVGVAVASTANLATDFQKAVDNTQSAAEPKL